MNLQFRLAGESDLVIVLRLMPLYYAHDHLDFDAEKAERALRSLVTNSHLGKLWLIENSGEAIGYLVLTYSFSLECGGREAFIDEFFILPEHRGSGIGTLALEHVVREGKKDELGAIRLEVTRTNGEAGRLYLRNGFEDLERTLLTYWLDGRKSL